MIETETETGSVTSDVRVAIVGCGRKASTIDDEGKCPVNYCQPPCAHAGAYALCPRTRLVAACAPSEASRRAFGTRWGLPAPELYDGYEAMLIRERPDLVSICTHAPLHAAVTIAAAGARGVLCEKAMATSLVEADAMAAACERSGTRLMVDHPRRFHPTYPLVRRTLASGEIGTLRVIVATASGAIVHNGTHLFDLVRYFGGDVVSVAASVLPTARGDGDGHCQLGLAGGIMAYVALHGGLPFSFELLGTDGRIAIDGSVDGATLWRYEAPPTSVPARLPPTGPPTGPAALAWYHGSPGRVRREHHALRHRRADRRRRRAPRARIERSGWSCGPGDCPGLPRLRGQGWVACGPAAGRPRPARCLPLSWPVAGVVEWVQRCLGRAGQPRTSRARTARR